MKTRVLQPAFLVVPLVLASCVSPGDTPAWPVHRLEDIDAPDPSGMRRAPAGAAGAGAAELARARLANLAELALSIEEARASALTNNLDLKATLLDPAIAREGVTREEARFEAAFTLRAGYQDLDSPTASQLASAQSTALSVTPGVTIPLRTGGTATVQLPFAKSDTDNTFATLNPAYSSDLALSISQPLLRGGGRRAATAPIAIAAYHAQAASAVTKLEVIRQLAAVDRAYWRLFAARRALEVRQQQYELATAQLDKANRLNQSGKAPEIEVIRAEAGLADRLEAIVRAQNDLLDRQRELKRIINLPGLTIETRTLVRTATLPDPVAYELDRDVLIASGLSQRMEMLELELRLAGDAATIALEQNNALPLLTLDYTYRVNGLGGSTQDSFHTLGRNRFEDWELGLTAQIPLGNEQAKSRVREALLRRLQRLGTRQARELSIRQEVLAAADQLDAAWQRIAAARQSVMLNARLLAGEQRQFEIGSRTSTDVLDAASKLAEAQLAEASALSDYQVAQVDLAFATGTLLGGGKVRLPEAPGDSVRGPRP